MKKLLKLLLILLLFLRVAGGGFLYAQLKGQAPALEGQAHIDSLLKELPKQKEDTNKANLLIAMSFTYNSINPDEGIKYGQQALALATKLEWKKGIANANNNIGVNYLCKSDYPNAKEYFQEALKIFEEIDDKKGIGWVAGNMGVVYMNQSDYPKALEYFSKNLKMAEEIGNKKSIATATANVGNVYLNLSDYPKALEYYFKALKMDEEIGNKSELSRVTGNIGTIYYYQREYSKALEYNFKALKMDEEIGNKKSIATVTDHIGGVYYSQSDYPRALEYELKALKIDEEIGNKNQIALVTGNIGEVYCRQKNYTMAIEFEQKSLKMAKEIGDKHTAAWQLEYMGHAYLSLVTDTPGKAGIVHSDEMPERKYLPEGQADQPNVTIPAGKTARLNKAIDCLQQSLDICKEIKALDVTQECYEYLSETYKLKGDYKNAVEYADSNKVIKDSIFSETNREQIAKLENVRKEYGDSLKAVAAKKAADITAQHRRNYEYIGAGAFLLLLGFTFLLTRNNKLLGKEKKRSDNLLLNILPEEVAGQLKDTGAAVAKQFDDVTVLFTDFVNFTEAGERMSPQALIEELHTCFKAFDEITGKYHVEKIKTIGDAYLAVAGLPKADSLHGEHIVRAAIEINAFMQDRVAKLGNRTFDIRIGIHSGSVVAGIVGVKKFAYDIWGDTVNTAARMEQSSEAGKINISQTTYELVKDKFSCEYRGEIAAKGKGQLKMYFVS